MEYFLPAWCMRTRLSLRLLLIAGLFALLGAACAPSGTSYRFVKSSDGSAFFRVPETWHMFNKEQMLTASNLAKSEEVAGRFQWLVGFDASRSPSVENVVSIASLPRDPTVQAYVRELSPETRDIVSLQFMRNSLLRVDELVASDLATVVDPPALVVMQESGAHGIRLTYDVAPLGAGSVTAQNQVVRVTQISLVDLQYRFFYQFYVSCVVDCYVANGTVIDQIVDSWTIKEQ